MIIRPSATNATIIKCNNVWISECQGIKCWYSVYILEDLSRSLLLMSDRNPILWQVMIMKRLFKQWWWTIPPISTKQWWWTIPPLSTKQWWWTIPPISTKRTTTSYLKQFNTKIPRHMDAGNAGHYLGQAQQYDGVKTVIEIQISSKNGISNANQI